MKEMPTDDPLFGKGTHPRRRPQDPRHVLFEVKKPAESKDPWDYYKVRRHDPGRRGVPSAERGRLPAGQEVTASDWRKERPTMIEIFGIPSQALFGQLLIGLINGSFYALLSSASPSSSACSTSSTSPTAPST